MTALGVWEPPVSPVLCRNQVKDPRVLMAADQPRMTEKLQEANMLLEDIQRGLNDYLEKKRLFFPRYSLLPLGLE